MPQNQYPPPHVRMRLLRSTLVRFQAEIANPVVPGGGSEEFTLSSTTAEVSGPDGVATGSFDLGADQVLLSLVRLTLPVRCEGCIFEVFDNTLLAGEPVLQTREFGLDDLTGNQLELGVVVEYEDADASEKLHWRIQYLDGPAGTFTLEIEGLTV